jgi:predicted transcriptional regulator
MLSKIRNYSGILKDTNSGAILNNDRKAVDEYHAKKKMLSSTRNLHEEIDSIKKDMEEIKELLRGLIK